MKIYFEYVLVDNLVINFLILLCVGKCLHLKFKGWALLLSAFMGAVVAMGLPLLKFSALEQLPFKIALGIGMLLMSFKFRTLGNFCIVFLTFLSFTFLMGGACLALITIFGERIDTIMGAGYDASVPLGLMLVVVAIYVKIVSEIAKFIYRKRDATQFIGQIEIAYGGKSVTCDGFIDSGNRLFDNKSGLPVIVVSTSVLKHILTPEMLARNYLPNGKLKKTPDFHFIQFATLSGYAKPMAVFRPQSVTFSYKGQKRLCQVMVGITSSKFKDATSYQALLHPSMIT